MTLQATIEAAWERRSELSAAGADDAIRDAVDTAIAGLDDGSLRVAEPGDDGWIEHEALRGAWRLLGARDRSLRDRGAAPEREGSPRVAQRLAPLQFTHSAMNTFVSSPPPLLRFEPKTR